MKNFKKKFTRWMTAFGRWLSKWTLFCLITGTFIVCSIMIGGVIIKTIWVVFAADLALYCTVWMTLAFVKHANNNEDFLGKNIGKFLALLASMIIMFILIVMATAGIYFIDPTKGVFNIFIFPVGLAATFLLFLRDSIRNFNRRLAK